MTSIIFLYIWCVSICVCGSGYTQSYGDQMSPQRGQYPKSLYLWGHFWVPMKNQQQQKT